MSAPFWASRPVWPMYRKTSSPERAGSSVSVGDSPWSFQPSSYRHENTSRADWRCETLDKLVSRPYESSCATEATGTPANDSARGKPRPKLTAVRTFSALGSISRTALPSQPSVAILSGSHVYQISIERKCEELGFGYPTPAMMAI